MLDEHVHHGFTAKEDTSREHTMCKAAKCVDVSAMVDIACAALLGRHVKGRAHGSACTGLVPREVIGEEFRDTEVQQLRVAASVFFEAEKDVLWFQVTVSDPGLMSCVERACDGPENG